MKPDSGKHWKDMAMRWGKGIKAGRVVEDFINMRDLAPTFLELAGLKPNEQMTGKSLVNILRAEKSGWNHSARVFKSAAIFCLSSSVSDVTAG